MEKKEEENIKEKPVDVVKETTNIVEEPTIDLEKFKSKDNDTIKKVDLSKLPVNQKEEETKNAVSEQGTGGVDEDASTAPVSEVEGGIRELQSGESENLIQEITEEKETETKQVEETVTPTPELEVLTLPENVEKLVSFMKDTGGTLEDFVRLNADYTNVDNTTLLKEYYKQTKPHLDLEEINFLMEDEFSFDEDMDEERDIRKKKLAIKEEVAKAKGFLDDLKSKYYDEIKLRPGVTQEQQKAMDFFNRYNEDQKMVKERHDAFKTTTKNYFDQDFKGFEFNLGEKKFRYGVNNPSEVADSQSDIATFIKTFLNDDGSLKDHKGYHKAIYAARNADTVAQHFYEQGKADAVKDISAKSKNISNKPRTTPAGDVFINGLRVKAVTGADSSKLRVKTIKR